MSQIKNLILFVLLLFLCKSLPTNFIQSAHSVGVHGVLVLQKKRETDKFNFFIHLNRTFQISRQKTNLIQLWDKNLPQSQPDSSLWYQCKGQIYSSWHQSWLRAMNRQHYGKLINEIRKCISLSRGGNKSKPRPHNCCDRVGDISGSMRGAKPYQLACSQWHWMSGTMSQRDFSSASPSCRLHRQPAT